MTRCVYDIDSNRSVCDGCVFRKNRNASFSLKLIAVHHLFNRLLIIAKQSALLEHDIDYGRLAMVDMRDYCDITQIF